MNNTNLSIFDDVSSVMNNLRRCPKCMKAYKNAEHYDRYINFKKLFNKKAFERIFTEYSRTYNLTFILKVKSCESILSFAATGKTKDINIMYAHNINTKSKRYTFGNANETYSNNYPISYASTDFIKRLIDNECLE